MYLHLGNDIVVKDEDIIGVFDIENTSISRHTKDFLAASEKNGRVVNVSLEMPKSYIVCLDEEGTETVFVSQISASTLRKRAGTGF